MAASKGDSGTRREKDARTVLAIVLIVAIGTIISGISLSFAHREVVIAQASSPQTFPVPAGKENGPAESKPADTRPTTPAPEPARPDTDNTGRTNPEPALPPAPAEKVAPPIKKN